MIAPATMSDPAILAAIPESLKDEFTAGQVYRVGMLLFRKGQPGIVSHLVETNALAPAASSMLPPNPYILSAKVATEAAGHIATNVQLQQVKAAVATLKVLQLGNVALSGAGLGFSIISHQLISMRLDKMNEQIQSLDEKLDLIAKQVDELRRDVVDRDFIKLRTATEMAENGWWARNPETEWLKAEEALHDLQNLFSDRVKRLLTQKAGIDAIEPFIDAMAMAGAVRVSCRTAARDLEVAHAIANRFADEFLNLLHPVGAERIVRSQLDERSISVGSPSYAVEADKLLPFAEAKSAAFREREEVAATRPATIQRLQALKMDGREFLERARSENEEPLLALR